MSENKGKIVQIIGPIIDVEFSEDIPNLLNAVEVINNDERIVFEVAHHLGDNIVRCVSMGSTDGLVRGMECIDTGNPIKVPVGRETLGRLLLPQGAEEFR
jgi:F-type H+-transporting ATPase subunit beta